MHYLAESSARQCVEFRSIQITTNIDEHRNVQRDVHVVRNQKGKRDKKILPQTGVDHAPFHERAHGS